jgi:cell division protein FtsN
LIGLALGLAIALGIAWYINKMPSPFSMRVTPPRNESSKPAPPSPATEDKSAKSSGEGKQRFDFYKILPGPDEASTERSKEGQKSSTAEGKEAFFLQAGAFSSAPEADNLKARLALLGVEATIQTSPAQDKGLWHRVRVGPYTSIEELNRTREILKQNGISTTLVKQREMDK